MKFDDSKYSGGSLGSQAMVRGGAVSACQGLAKSGLWERGGLLGYFGPVTGMRTD